MNPQILQDIQKIYPELAVTAALLCVVVADLVCGRLRRNVTFALTALGLAVAFWLTLPLAHAPQSTLFFGMLALDPMAVFFKAFFLLTSFLILMTAPGSKELAKTHLGEFYSLLLAVTLGMMLLAASTDMLMLFLSLEMVSVCSYVMVGYLKNDRQSNEASLKYVLFGAVSTGAMLYGITLLFGVTGSTKMAAIREVLAGGGGAGGNSLLLLVATAMLLAGFGFKTAAVPFHFWCPDVYTGAPTPVTAFLSVGPKAAGFAILVRFFFTGLSRTGNPAPWTSFDGLNWTVLLLGISIVTMTLGNLAALRQDDMKRMLAYSSIAHAGYLFMGAVVLTSEGVQAILIYLIAYLFMNLGAFLVVIEIYNRTGSFNLNDYKGMYRRSPFLTIAMAVFMLSLMGIPPFAGFFGKFFVFAAAVNHNLAWYAVVGALNSVIAVYYYARVIKTMIIDEGAETGALRISWANHLLVWAMLLPTAGLVVFWDRVQALTRDSMSIFFGS
jgi:NADH-quinone oxidoreductase subunit N